MIVNVGGDGRHFVKDAKIWYRGNMVELREDDAVVDVWFAEEHAGGHGNGQELNQRGGSSSD